MKLFTFLVAMSLLVYSCDFTSEQDEDEKDAWLGSFELLSDPWGYAGSQLEEPIRLKLLDREGIPVVSREFEYYYIRTINPGQDDLQQTFATAITNDQGVAEIQFVTKPGYVGDFAFYITRFETLFSFPVHAQNTGVLVDERDTTYYNTARFGNIEVMTENLKFSLSEVISLNDREIGYFYSFYEAVNVCPEGWHLLTNRELDTILTIVNYGQLLTDYSYTSGHSLDPRRFSVHYNFNMPVHGVFDVQSGKADTSLYKGAIWIEDKPKYIQVGDTTTHFQTSIKVNKDGRLIKEKFMEPEKVKLQVRCSRKL
jgi:uncharacterized protein (TIGR02145 family)